MVPGRHAIEARADQWRKARLAADEDAGVDKAACVKTPQPTA
jgi:hypothetical protein